MVASISQIEIQYIQLYCNMLEEIKLRIKSVMDIINQRKLANTDLSSKAVIEHHFEIEYICLQIRKVLEFIIFGTLVVNKDIYEKTYQDFKNHWNVKKIIKKIENLNKNYYPIPLYFENSIKNIDSGSINHHLAVLKTGFLTKEEFVFLYDKCSKIIHSPNPFQDNFLVNFSDTLEEWMYKISSLINLHQIKLINSNYRWLITLIHPLTGNVKAQLMKIES